MTLASSKSYSGPNDFRLCNDAAFNEEADDGVLRTELELVSVNVDCEPVEIELAVVVMPAFSDSRSRSGVVAEGLLDSDEPSSWINLYLDVSVGFFDGMRARSEGFLLRELTFVSVFDSEGADGGFR